MFIVECTASKDKNTGDFSCTLATSINLRRTPFFPDVLLHSLKEHTHTFLPVVRGNIKAIILGVAVSRERVQSDAQRPPQALALQYLHSLSLTPQGPETTPIAP
jgi:hypothetical protein